MKTWWPIVRLAGAALSIAAVVAQLALTVSLAAASTTPWGSHLPTVWANFFAFFTIDSNVLAALVLIAAAVWGLRHRADDRQEPVWLAVPLLCVSTYMVVTGIVYNTLLRSVELPQGVTVPWSNEVLHVVFPLLLFIDVIVAPRRQPLPWRAALIAAIFPIVWVTYTLLRADTVIAPATGDPWWYPYPFLDPRFVGGYGGVAAYVTGIAVCIIGVALIIIWVRGWKAASQVRRPN